MTRCWSAGRPAVVCEERVNAEWAVQRALDEIAVVFDDVKDPYLHDRKGDLHDVAGRLRMNLRDEKGARATCCRTSTRPAC